MRPTQSRSRQCCSQLGPSLVLILAAELAAVLVFQLDGWSSRLPSDQMMAAINAFCIASSRV